MSVRSVLPPSATITSTPWARTVRNARRLATMCDASFSVGITIVIRGVIGEVSLAAWA